MPPMMISNNGYPYSPVMPPIMVTNYNGPPPQLPPHSPHPFYPPPPPPHLRLDNPNIYYQQIPQFQHQLPYRPQMPQQLTIPQQQQQQQQQNSWDPVMSTNVSNIISNNISSMSNNNNYQK
jgi:hypothetical protein